MSPYRRFVGIQIAAVVLWLTGVTVLIGYDLRDYAALWFGVCAVMGLSSYLIGCPKCGMSVGLSRLNGFFAAHRRLVCSRCGKDLKERSTPTIGSAP